MNTLAAPFGAVQALAAADVTTADPMECSTALSLLRQVRGWADAVEAQVTARVAALHAAGAAPAPDDAHSHSSGVSAAEGRRRARRSDTISQAPAFGDALATGDVTAEHIDALASTCTKLDDDVRAALFGQADALLTHAAAHTPGEFARHCRDLARTLEHHAGIERDARQRRDTRLSWKIDDDGMYAIHARLHPEAGNALINALEHDVKARVAAGERAGIREYVDRTVDRARLMAEALCDFVAGGHQLQRPLVADITYIIDARTADAGEYHDHSVCETGHGAPLPIESVRAKLCGGLITPVYIDADGNVLDLGRTQRAVSRK